MISYNDPFEAAYAAKALGLPDFCFYDQDGAQAYRFRNEWDAVIACRGTEAHEWNDIKADMNVGPALAETVGKVHRGFKREVDDLWPMLEIALKENRLPLWFCGHSLGGAMATICAARCVHSYIDSNPEELYTFGSPRVGCKTYINHAKLTYYRWVNNNDIVTRVPPRWMGYAHAGQEIYLNYRGRIRRLTGWQRTKDRTRGFLLGLKTWSFDYFRDHAIHNYIRHIITAVSLEEGRNLLDEEPSEVIELPQTKPADQISSRDRQSRAADTIAG
jgi:triacylglycerol lipase